MTTENHPPGPVSGLSPVEREPVRELVPQYEIRVAGRLAPRWSAWLDGLAVTTDDDGTTVIRGPVVDQAALHGLLQKLRDIAIPLLSVTQLSGHETTNLPAHPTQKEN